MRLIIVIPSVFFHPQSLDDEGEKYHRRKMHQELFLTYQHAMQLIDIFETTFPYVQLSYLRSLLCYYCAEVQYYRNRFHEAIGTPFPRFG